MDAGIKRCLHKHWIHSHEEDSGGISVYRPTGYRFPPSRGRDSFHLQPSGAVERGDPGPDDRGRVRSGKWKSSGENALQIHVDGDSNPRQMTIVECNNDMLKVRWH